MLIKRFLFGAFCLIALSLTACAAVQPAASSGADSDETHPTVAPAGDIATGFNSAVIIVREGLEAVLVIAVITSYMKTTRRDMKYARLVYYGVGAAVLLSIILWVLSVTLLRVTEE